MSSRRNPFVVLIAGVLLLSAACGSADDAAPESTSTSTSTTRAAAPELVGPDEFAARVEDPKVVTINVHVPNEGNIAGTDLAVPFDEISSSTELPADLATPIAVYCQSGNMSATTVEDLQDKGYTNVVELEGGYEAWLEAGRTLERS
jgi:phage shock protein E